MSDTEQITQPDAATMRHAYYTWSDDRSIGHVTRRFNPALCSGIWDAAVEWCWLTQVQPHLDNLRLREREADAQASSRMLARLDAAAAVAMSRSDWEETKVRAQIREQFSLYSDLTLLNEERTKVATLAALLNKACNEIDRLEAGLPAVEE